MTKVMTESLVPTDDEIEAVLHEQFPETANAQQAPAQPAPQQEAATLLPDGSAFAVMSYPLPKTHWLYAPREYAEGAEDPKELPAPILTHARRDAVVAAMRYAVRGATMCGTEADFDPDALVQNAVYALCGPFGQAAAPQPSPASQWDALLAATSTALEVLQKHRQMKGDWPMGELGRRAAEELQAARHAIFNTARAGFFLRLPQRPKPEAPAGTVGLDWDAYSGAQLLAYGRDCSNAAIVATQKQGGL